MFEKIIQNATIQDKKILILGSPRSGTHVLGEELATISGARNFFEICKVGYCNNPWDDLNNLIDAKEFSLAHIVQLTPKIILAQDVEKIKDKCIIVDIKRKNKVEQFSSWIYFRVLDPTGLHGWHNHSANKTKLNPGEIEAKIEDIIQFQLEQLIDEYFLPDFSLCYEDLKFNRQRIYKKNEFTFPLPEIFSNLDFVKQQLGSWKYSSKHFTGNE